MLPIDESQLFAMPARAVSPPLQSIEKGTSTTYIRSKTSSTSSSAAYEQTVDQPGKRRKLNTSGHPAALNGIAPPLGAISPPRSGTAIAKESTVAKAATGGTFSNRPAAEDRVKNPNSMEERVIAKSVTKQSATRKPVTKDPTMNESVSKGFVVKTHAPQEPAITVDRTDVDTQPIMKNLTASQPVITSDGGEDLARTNALEEESCNSALKVADDRVA